MAVMMEALTSRHWSREMAQRVDLARDDAMSRTTGWRRLPCVDALRRHWPEATDEEIARGFNFSLVLAEAW